MVYSASIIALAALLSLANGHMIMKTPVPYGKSSLNNSPLVGDGSDFPCKQRAGVYDAEGASNVMPIGAPQTLSFTGSAVHGGGSCQVSLTTDKAPTKDSKWMVIHSILGGCPANVAGNLPADPNGGGASTFQFSIPDGISPGEYTLGWTWFNKIGNREMYMNCAPVTVTGAKARRYAAPFPKINAPTTLNKRAPSFPDMFVANLKSINTCGTLENFDVMFPDPGSSVQTVEGSQFTPPVSCSSSGSGAVATGASSGSGSSLASSAPAATSAATAPEASSESVPADGASSAASPTVAPGVFASGASSPSGAAVATTAPAAPAATAATPSAASPASSPSSSSSGTSGTLSGPCTNEGAWNCIDGSSFQRCASGAWSATISMAAGTKCTPGQSDTLTMEKRSAFLRSPAHVRRSLNAWGH